MRKLKKRCQKLDRGIFWKPVMNTSRNLWNLTKATLTNTLNRSRKSCKKGPGQSKLSESSRANYCLCLKLVRIVTNFPKRKPISLIYWTTLSEFLPKIQLTLMKRSIFWMKITTEWRKLKKESLSLLLSENLKATSNVNISFNSAKALILHGPPGVGKSSIAKSIARCLGRSYERISLGGEVDPDLLRGHRRTYIASYPGKIFSAISRCKTDNPVILLDEIDKIDIRRNGSSLQDVIL